MGKVSGKWSTNWIIKTLKEQTRTCPGQEQFDSYLSQGQAGIPLFPSLFALVFEPSWTFKILKFAYCGRLNDLIIWNYPSEVSEIFMRLSDSVFLKRVLVTVILAPFASVEASEKVVTGGKNLVVNKFCVWVWRHQTVYHIRILGIGQLACNGGLCRGISLMTLMSFAFEKNPALKCLWNEK